MSEYQAPIRDMRFVLYELLEADRVFASMPATAEVSRELVDQILEEGGRIAGTLLAPLERQGDEEGCHFDQGQVRTPEGFRDAYQTYAGGGWVGLAGDPGYEGQGMPKMLSVLFEEMIMGANCAFALYPILSAGATLALARHASEDLKRLYLPRLYSGAWSATMCLTEAHAGTDLGLIRTRAEPGSDGSYSLTGTKIFITGGEHDLCDNIIHLVLARLPDAPEGSRGISLFLVPKFLPDGDGEIASAERNAVSCGSLEQKMGIKGSATCVMNFDGAKGWLVGEPHRGLACMFTMMNYERLSIGLQGLGLAEASYQTAVSYARERLQGRAASGPQSPDKAADPLIVHPDVRRMLLTMRASIQGGRALAGYVALQLDLAHFHPDEETRERARKLVALLTPVAKASFTDRGLDACILGQQVLGGHGYIREWGQEQKVRDARIAQIYEGTNGIQALDLMGRKVIRDREGLLDVLLSEIRGWIEEMREDASGTGEDEESGDFMSGFIEPLEEALAGLAELSEQLRRDAETRPDTVGAASVPYLDLVALVLYAAMWARMVRIALARRTEDPTGFYEGKVQTGRFFMSRLFPRYRSLIEEIAAGPGPLMSLESDYF